jgi:hypothetical protein
VSLPTPCALLLVAVACLAGLGNAPIAASGAGAADPAIVTVFPVPRPRGLMVTTGGWAYCEQVRLLAQRAHYTLACGRYFLDGYLGPGLRSHRHLDWGNPAYLASFASKIGSLHRRVGRELLLIGVSYSGFGVATLASHHPELRPDRVIVIDSYLNLVARRSGLPPRHETALEIDGETGGSRAELEARSTSVGGLVRLARSGTRLVVIWSVSEDERREFLGATCNRDANAGTLLQLADALARPLVAWVTESRHGHDLWNHGAAIVAGRYPGRDVTFEPEGSIPTGSVCPG